MDNEADQQDEKIYILQFENEGQNIRLLLALDKDAQAALAHTGQEVTDAQGWEKYRILLGQGAMLSDVMIFGTRIPAEQWLDEKGRVTAAWWNNGDDKSIRELSADELADLNSRLGGFEPGGFSPVFQHISYAARITVPAPKEETAATVVKAPQKKSPSRALKQGAAVAAFAVVTLFATAIWDGNYNPFRLMGSLTSNARQNNSVGMEMKDENRKSEGAPLVAIASAEKNKIDVVISEVAKPTQDGSSGKVPDASGPAALKGSTGGVMQGTEKQKGAAPAAASTLLAVKGQPTSAQDNNPQGAKTAVAPAKPSGAPSQLVPEGKTNERKEAQKGAPVVAASAQGSGSGSKGKPENLQARDVYYPNEYENETMDERGNVTSLGRGTDLIRVRLVLDEAAQRRAMASARDIAAAQGQKKAEFLSRLGGRTTEEEIVDMKSCDPGLQERHRKGKATLADLFEDGKCRRKSFAQYLGGMIRDSHYAADGSLKEVVIAQADGTAKTYDAHGREVISALQALPGGRSSVRLDPSR